MTRVVEEFRELLASLKSTGRHVAVCTIYRPNFEHFFFKSLALIQMMLRDLFGGIPDPGGIQFSPWQVLLSRLIFSTPVWRLVTVRRVVMFCDRQVSDLE